MATYAPTMVGTLNSYFFILGGVGLSALTDL